METFSMRLNFKRARAGAGLGEANEYCCPPDDRGQA